MGVQEEKADETELERLWVEEAERRFQDYIGGKIKAVPGEEAIRRIRAALARQSSELG